MGINRDGGFTDISRLVSLMTEAERKVSWVSNWFYTPIMDPNTPVFRLEDLIPLILEVKDEAIVRELYDIERILHPEVFTRLLSGDNLKVYGRGNSQERIRTPGGTIVLGVNGLRDAAVITGKCPSNNMFAVIDTDVNHYGYDHGRGDLLPTSAVAAFVERAFSKKIPSVIYSTQKYPVPPCLHRAVKELGASIFYHSEMEDKDVKAGFLKAVKGNGHMPGYG